jgi:hypothetical protein
MIKNRLSLLGRLVFFIPAALVYFLSTSPTYTFSDENDSSFVIGLKHLTDRVHVCNEEEVRLFLENEAKKGVAHSRKRAKSCGSRNRKPLKLKVWLDGKEIVNKVYKPSGLFGDGNTFIFEKFEVHAGEHNIKAAMRDSKEDKEDRYDYSFERNVNFNPKRVVVLDFDSLTKLFILN